MKDDSANNPRHAITIASYSKTGKDFSHALHIGVHAGKSFVKKAISYRLAGENFFQVDVIDNKTPFISAVLTFTDTMDGYIPYVNRGLRYFPAKTRN